jgi:lysylphosphatidylglycerol synthetase-like protein (DUF2156 family)
MKHIIYFLAGAFVVFLFLLFANQLPIFLELPEVVEAPVVIRTILGLTIILITAFLFFISYKIGHKLLS